MNFFKKLLGSKKDVAATAAQPDAASPGSPVPQPPESETVRAPAQAPEGVDPASDPTMIRTVDAQGRETFVPRAEWRENVLLPLLEKVREEPDQLAQVILQALNEGFLTDLAAPAEQLARIDPHAERGAVILAIVYRELQRFAAAEAVLRQHLEAHGESSIVVANLGKIQAAQGETAAAEETYWRAVELDPNQPDAFGTLLGARHAQGGDAAVEEAIQRLSALPGSWRARLWLARAPLAKGQVDEALTLYREALKLAGQPAPADLLVQMSAELGQAGQAAVMLREVAPLFEVGTHGLPVAHNLFRACLETGNLIPAQGLLDLLFAQERLEWRGVLGQWDHELTRARLAGAGRNQNPGRVAMLVDEGPVWLPPRSPAGELFTRPAGEGPQIAFLGSSIEVGGEKTDAALQPTDAPGRLSRAVPLYLAEQVHFGTHARVRPLVPWVQGEIPAFAIGRQPWTAAEAVQHARAVKPICDYAVVTHVQATAEPWRIELRLVRTADGAVIGATAVEFTLASPEEPLRKLVVELLDLLRREAGTQLVPEAACYLVPQGGDFGLYLLRLEQLLTLRCHHLPGSATAPLGGERDILDGALHLCLTQAGNVGTRLVFVEALRALRGQRPQVVAEYRSRVQLLQKERPLAAPAQAVIQRMVDELYS